MCLPEVLLVTVFYTADIVRWVGLKGSIIVSQPDDQNFWNAKTS